MLVETSKSFQTSFGDLSRSLSCVISPNSLMEPRSTSLLLQSMVVPHGDISVEGGDDGKLSIISNKLLEGHGQGEDESLEDIPDEPEFELGTMTGSGNR
ncbi:hypothetical protein PanWU01x14_368620 [Parasponia andersonii]|uniref:Uncharacterized protein n=1 Tax=Parasponia andersonii TaxID=3476 RepID=A0A2P5A4Z0_PARAD|nr:hypothetical protein PanWU01x14_368620 [Parasponia andersonii]